ncbi:FtsX-like permease family protein [Desulfopila inferna]|uniref:FtsX-like permease family protein n=1 Tax=Desulfopila inferna TaxID=468528 RepID=UPI001963B219|nr:ABC transporter permease [Desulfopila inferna]MBM9605529.1 ABC transporter permease [Desulfopila inferna]
MLQSQVLAEDSSHKSLVKELTLFGDRSTGSTGNSRAAAFIFNHFEKLGFSPQHHSFTVPVRKVHDASMQLGEDSIALQPFLYNAITPQGIDGTLTGPLYYVASGTMPELSGKPIKDSIVLMDFDSGLNWQTAASLGAKAAILVDKGNIKGRHFFEEKTELSPIQFPIFWITEQEAVSLFGDLTESTSPVAESITLHSAVEWQETIGQNIYCFVEGNDPSLRDELLVIDAFYDNSVFLPGQAPGADEATSIVTLLKTAEHLSRAPPGRSILLLASSGHSEALAGFRELIWSLQSKEKDLSGYHKLLMHDIEQAQSYLEELASVDFPLAVDQERDNRLKEAVDNTLKASIDQVTRELVNLRLNREAAENKEKIDKLVERRFALRQLSWKRRFDDLDKREITLFEELIPATIAEHEKIIDLRKKHLEVFETSLAFRENIEKYRIAAFISLHLSSHGTGIGGFHEGWLYQLKPNINRTGIYSAAGDAMRQFAQQSGSSTPYIDSLSPSRMRTWDTWFLGTPFHGGEVSSLAGYLGFTLATIGDARHLWGTPWDTFDSVDWKALVEQEKLVTYLVGELSRVENLSTGRMPRNGFSTVTGRANLLLQGELFADYPAQGTTIMAFQGQARFYATVDSGGTFHLKGVADSKNVVDKVIIEGYRFDGTAGRVKWAIDKNETDKDNYRLKIRRENTNTDLTLFSCTETTIFDLLEPRNFNYLTKIDLLDGRRDAPPTHYWYSRIDTRSSIISSIYTEPGTWLKLTLSDTVLTRKLLLTNSTEKSPLGYGYPVNTYSSIPNTSYHAAEDIWTLLKPRINNLEKHGIVDPQVNALEKKGLAALEKSRRALDDMDYGTFKESTLQALALAGRVYVQVEKTQKDVLFGVLFYIALFVPFSFCLERFLFNYANIYKRISAFTAILVILISVIYNVHPAFQLAYSPMVVILAFFIIGLSLMVSFIVFSRFEEEMIILQRHASHKRPSEISRWKAFVAAFFLGVSNLRRRRLRTILTCLTLIILTFTIMSFTTVKSSLKANKLLFQEDAPYAGLLIKSFNWQSLPRQAETAMSAGSADRTTAARIWLEGRSMTRPVQVPLYHQENTVELRGLIGMDPAERKISAIDSILTSGRWFTSEDRYAILLGDSSTARLGLKAEELPQTVYLWGMEFTVIGTFSGSRLDAITDLDGEPLTPVTFPEEVSTELSEVEQEAMVSGEDVRSLQSRYRHIAGNQVAVIPAKTLYAMGGSLKSVAIKPGAGRDIQEIASRLVERFSLPIFAGDASGVWFFSPSNTLSYSGVPNILIPLIISVFIVLNTMISSVYERKNEIAVYTSVGLAPSHVSFLFIAEAMALAVISVVFGYLLAQVSAALFSTTPYWAGITVNYSSLAGVAAMILIMAVVLLSVIYPSRVAAKIAIPDVKQTFQLPTPVNNRIEVTLPFFMKYEENESIGGFLYSYLTGHQDISHGMFSTGQVDIVFSCTTAAEIKEMVIRAAEPSSLNCLHIRAKVWLAPFDFGIMQWIDIQFCPVRENPEYLEIKISLQRNSGEIEMWKRTNKIFLHDIRKQLLIWRSLDDEGHTSYRIVLQEALGHQDPLPAGQTG